MSAPRHPHTWARVRRKDQIYLYPQHPAPAQPAHIEAKCDTTLALRDDKRDASIDIGASRHAVAEQLSEVPVANGLEAIRHSIVTLCFVDMGSEMVLNQPVGPDPPDGLQITLERLGLDEFYGRLSANRVSEDQIGELSEADLLELGLTPEERRRFLRALIEPVKVAPAGQQQDRAHGAPEIGERRQVTSLFCDLVASTPLAFRLDPEDFRDVIRVFHDICADVITRGSGYVAQYLSDGVLAHFGYPRAREDDAQSAARAALEIVAKVGQMRAPDGEPLSARVGIATGLVVGLRRVYRQPHSELERSVVGNTLNLAARLQAVAGPGQIIISKATRRLCGAMFEYEEKGDIVLKGFPAPVHDLPPADAKARRRAALTRAPFRASILSSAGSRSSVRSLTNGALRGSALDRSCIFPANRASASLGSHSR